MRGLVVSGGGRKGAEAAGYIDGLIQSGVEWQYFGGTSTGSLIAGMRPSASTIAAIKEAYTTTENKDLWTINPFRKRVTGKLWNWMRSKIKLKHSIGDFSKLQEFIGLYYTERHHEQGRNTQVDACCVSERGKTVYFNLARLSYQEAIAAMYGSSSPPIFTQGSVIRRVRYFDGGIREHVPLQRAVEAGCSEIDVIVLRSEFPSGEGQVKSVWDAVGLTLDSLLYEISYSDMLVASLSVPEGREVVLNIYYGQINDGNSFDFDPPAMQVMYETGLQAALSERLFTQYHVANSGSVKTKGKGVV